MLFKVTITHPKTSYNTNTSWLMDAHAVEEQVTDALEAMDEGATITIERMSSQVEEIRPDILMAEVRADVSEF